MRNLKKILALVLALVLSLSLVTIASGADFNDADEIELTEAVDVMTTIGVLEGHNTGDFAPQGTLTREQAAKIITYMLLGENADRLSVASTSFSDVAATRWSAADIEYCSTLGIIAGYGDGTFNPSGTLTGYAFAKMLLTALGYKADAERLTGTGWTINVSRLALQVGLNKGIEDISWGSSITREQAAQMALNAIKTPMVQYNDGVTVIVNGQPVTFGSGEAYYVTTTLAQEQRIGKETLSNTNNTYTVEFGERYFPNLRLDDATDDFGRPAYTWTYKTQEIGTYVDESLMVAEYTTGVTGGELYNLLSRNTIKEYTLTYYVDGTVTAFDKDVLYRTNNSSVGSTGRGVLTQVFVDHVEEEITLVSVNTYLAKANSDYNTTRETVSLQVYYGDNLDTAKTVSVEDVPAVADLKEGDIVLVNWASDSATVNTKDIVAISDPEVMSGVTVNRFSKDANDDKKANGVSNADRVTLIKTGGEEYRNNRNAWYDEDTLSQYNDDRLVNKTYNVYLDPYGNFIGAELATGTAQYVFIAAYDTYNSSMGMVNGDALAIFPDGQMKKIEVNVKDTNENIERIRDNTAGNTSYNATVANDPYYQEWDSNATAGSAKINGKVNRWFTYTLAGDVYTLEPVTRYTVDVNDNEVTGGGAKVIRTDSLSLGVNTSNDIGGRSYGNDESVYITVNDNTQNSYGTNVIDEVTGVYTGVDSARLSYANGDWVVAVYDSDYYIIAAIVLGEAEGAVDNYAYILSGAYAEERKDDGYTYWDFDAVLNGEIRTMTIKSKYQGTVDQLVKNSIQELMLDADGYVTKINTLTDNDSSDAFISRYTVGTTDQVYSNADMAAHSAVSGYDVYHMWADTSTGKGIDMYLTGRVLHFGPAVDETGLFFANDAKAVVSQSVNSDRTETEYGSVKEAYSVLTDTDDTKTGLQFNGEVAAVLDADGVAKWVFFYDYTDVETGDRPDYGDVTIGKIGGATGLNVDSLDPTANSHMATYIKGQKDGTYVLSDKYADMRGNASDNIVFKFTTSVASDVVTLTITNTAGAPVYVESGTFAAVGGHFFYAQVTSADGTLINAGSGSMKTTALTSGTYNWSVKGASCDLSGTFTIK